MTIDEWNICEDYAIKLFKYGQKVCDNKGLILVDTKYEFGKDEQGTILLVDELHTPDSSRFWIKHTYEECINEEKEPINFDKEIIRKWIKQKQKTPNNTEKENNKIDIPHSLIENVSNVYMQLNELLTS